MSKTETIRARVEPELKSRAERVLHRLGLTPTEAIRLFYRQVTLHRGLPFPVRIPRAETRTAMEQARQGPRLTRWPDIETAKSKLG